MLSSQEQRCEVNRLLLELREEHDNIKQIFIDLGDDDAKYHFILQNLVNMYKLRGQLQELAGDLATAMIAKELEECSPYMSKALCTDASIFSDFQTAGREKELLGRDEDTANAIANWDERNPLEPTPLPSAIHRKGSTRKVLLSAHITLDGFMAGPKGELDWAIMDEEIDNHVLPDLLRTGDTALLGRVLYQGFANYWPSTQKERLSLSKGATAFAHWIDEVPKVVFSRTLQSVAWQNSRLVQGDIAEEIAKLKQQPGKNLLLFGGVRTAQTFVKRGLIDEYRLLVHPVILGHGLPLFADKKDRINLRLVRTKAYDAGAVLLCYQVEKE